MNGWKKIADEQPQDGQRVLVTAGSYIELLTYNGHENCWDDSEGDDYERDLDYYPYWHELPALPEDAKA
jgi:hypothetical protein